MNEYYYYYIIDLKNMIFYYNNSHIILLILKTNIGIIKMVVTGLGWMDVLMKGQLNVIISIKLIFHFLYFDILN